MIRRPTCYCVRCGWPMYRRYRRYAAPLPRIAYAEEAVRAYMQSDAYRAVRYRKWRPYVLAGILAWMLARRLTR